MGVWGGGLSIFPVGDNNTAGLLDVTREKRRDLGRVWAGCFVWLEGGGDSLFRMVKWRSYAFEWRSYAFGWGIPRP